MYDVLYTKPRSTSSCTIDPPASLGHQHDMRLFFPSCKSVLVLKPLLTSPSLSLYLSLLLLPINLLLSRLSPRCPRCPRQYSAGTIGLHRQPTTNFFRLLPFLPVNSPSSTLFYRIIIFPTKQVPSLLNWSSFIRASCFCCPWFSTPSPCDGMSQPFVAAQQLQASWPRPFLRFIVGFSSDQ